MIYAQVFTYKIKKPKEMYENKHHKGRMTGSSEK